MIFCSFQRAKEKKETARYRETSHACKPFDICLVCCFSCFSSVLEAENKNRRRASALLRSDWKAAFKIKWKTQRNARKNSIRAASGDPRELSTEGKKPAFSTEGPFSTERHASFFRNKKGSWRVRTRPSTIFNHVGQHLMANWQHTSQSAKT